MTITREQLYNESFEIESKIIGQQTQLETAAPGSKRETLCCTKIALLIRRKRAVETLIKTVDLL